MMNFIKHIATNNFTSITRCNGSDIVMSWFDGVKRQHWRIT